jgi:hypothetical protein
MGRTPSWSSVIGFGKFSKGSLVSNGSVYLMKSQTAISAPPHIPNSFAALRQPSIRPPLRPPTNPSLPTFFRVHRLETHAKLEFFHFGPASRPFAISVEGYYLGADDCIKWFRVHNCRVE